MEVRVETLEELKRIRFSQFDKVFCTEKEREYYLLNDAGLTPDDEDIVQAAHGASYRWVAQKARNSGGGGGGEANTGANIGTGVGVFRNKTGATLNFKSLVAGTNITLTPNADEIEISALGGGGSAYPDNFTIITAPTTLTPAHQGIVFCIGAKVTLPASAPDGTTYKLIGSPGDVIINTNGAPIAGLGVGTDIKPGDPVITIVAVNIPNLIWGIANKKAAYNYHSDRTYLYGDIVQDSGNYYLSVSDNNLGHLLTDSTKWLSLSDRVITGSIALSDMFFTGTTAPTNCVAGYVITQLSGNAVLLDILMNFPSPGVGITQTGIGIYKASEIRDAITNMLGSGDEDLFGTGHVAHNGGFASAIPVTAIYSPTNLEYILAKHSAINLYEGRMQFVIRRS
jgi:hypothetical protein